MASPGVRVEPAVMFRISAPALPQVLPDPEINISEAPGVPVIRSPFFSVTRRIPAVSVPVVCCARSSAARACTCACSEGASASATRFAAAVLAAWAQLSCRLASERPSILPTVLQYSSMGLENTVFK